MFTEVSKPLCAKISEISKIRRKYRMGLWYCSYSNILIFANYQVSCFIRNRQGVLSVPRPNFLTCLDKNDIRQNEKDNYCVMIKCLHRLIWNGTFHWRSLFSWIGNFFPLPQVVADIPGMLQFLQFVGTICFKQSCGSSISLPYKRLLTYITKTR